MAVTINRIGTKTNLQDGGTYDLLVMGFANGFPRGYISFEMGDDPRRVTGVQKVVQTFLRVLLTSKGSDPIHPAFGTAFPEYFAFSNIGTDEEEMRMLVSDSIQDAEQQTKAILNSSRRDKSSQLASINMLFIEVSGEALNIGLKVVTGDGESASIAVPFPQSDLAINA